jgi:hypothetical protein
MHIDIDRLTEAELHDLNHRIVARLRFLHQTRAHASMLEFRIGERVSFRPPDRGTVLGSIVRYNKKTVTVMADDGARWNVSPHLLERQVEQQRPGKGATVIPLPRSESSEG